MNLIKRIVRKLKTILRKTGFISKKLSNYDNKNISIIRNSQYFDINFYISKYKDVVNAGMDPATHYYFFGWKEGRNPSEEFSGKLYMKLNEGKMPDMNPLLHFETVGKNKADIIGPGNSNFNCLTSASELLEDFFDQIPIFKTLPVSRDTKRLNIVFNGYDKSCFFGGKATALILAIQFATRYNYDFRIISQNPDPSILREFLELFELETPQNVEYFSYDSKNLLEISESDDFLCTMWENAAAVLSTPAITGNVYYIMQEVETLFYDHGDMHLKCLQTLTNDRLIPVVNSKLLYDYLIQSGYKNVASNGMFFEPVFSPKLLKPSKTSFAKKDKYTLFYYGRPSHQRNIFYFGLDCLNEAFLTGKLNPDEWTVVLAGDMSVPKFRFDIDVEIKRLGVMSWKEYCDFASTVDLCYSMIYTPHPSYPPLDTTTAGAVCVTNRCNNKIDLSCYSENIVMADLTKESMLEAFVKGSELAKDIDRRKKNYENSHTAGSWYDAFAPVLEHMHKFAEEKNV